MGRSGASRRGARVLCALLAVVSVSCAEPLDVSTPQRPVATPDPGTGRGGLRFEAAPGWHVRTSDPATTDERAAQAWAANVPFAEDEEPIGEVNHFPGGWPDRTEDTLPPDGILLVANYSLQTRNPLPATKDYLPERSLPLTIDEPPGGLIEGQDPQHAHVAVNAVVHGRPVSVRIVFGTAEPSEELVAEAERELGRLVVPPRPETTEAIDDFGIRMTVPERWHRILFRWPAGEPTLHVATVPVTDLYDGSSARRALGPRDFFVVLSENLATAAWYEDVSLPVAIRPHDECRGCEILDNGTSPPPGHTLFYRSFSVDGRRFDLYAEFGTPAPGDADLTRVNVALATLDIGPPGSPPLVESFGDVEDRRVRADVPSGWIASDDPVPGSSVVAAYGTWDFPPRGGCGPEPALADLPDDGALVWVVEHTDPINAGDYIELQPGFTLDSQTPPARWECARAAPSRMYLFEVDGRYLEVHLATGDDVDERTIEEANDLIRSLRA